MADKEYKDLTPEERYDSAVKADAEPWNPLKAAKELIIEKFSPKKETPKKKYKKGGSVKSSASKRADGIASKGKTKGRIV